MYGIVYSQTGDKVTVWIRATDVMGDIIQDSTYVIVDNTLPILEPTNQSIPANETEELQTNINNSIYEYASRYVSLYHL